MGFLEAEFAQVVLADVLDVPVAASNRSRPSRSMSATRSGHWMSKTSGCWIGDRHHHLAQASVACVARHALVSLFPAQRPIMPNGSHTAQPPSARMRSTPSHRCYPG